MILLLALACAHQQVQPAVIEADPVIPAPIVESVPGVLQVLITDYSPISAAELVCAGGYRHRVTAVDRAISFPELPESDCRIFFKGLPAQFYPVSAGTLSCHFVGSTAVCEQD